MNIRTTLMLFIILAASMSLFAYLQWREVGTAAERTERGRWILPTLKMKGLGAEDVSQLAIHRPASGEMIEFQRQDRDWKMTKPSAWRTNSSAVSDLVFQLIGLARDPYNEVPDAPGMNQPHTIITLTLDRKRASDLAIPSTYEVRIAADDPKSERFFIMSSESKVPIAMARQRLERLLAPAADFRATNLFTTAEKDVVGLALRQGERKLAFQKVQTAAADPPTRPGFPAVETAEWRFTSPPLGDADRTVLADLAGRLSRLRVKKAADFLVDGDLNLEQRQKYGLEVTRIAGFEVGFLNKDGAAGDVEEIIRVGKRTPESEKLIRHAPMIANALALPLRVDSAAMLAASDPGSDAPASPARWFAEEVKTGSYFVHLPHDQSVVRLDLDHAFIKLATQPTDAFRSRGVVRFDRPHLDAINLIQPGGDTLRFRRLELQKGSELTAEKWDLYYKDRPRVGTHANVVNDLLSHLNEVQLQAFDPAQASPFLDTPAKQAAWFRRGWFDAPVDLGLDEAAPKTVVELYVHGLKRDKDGKLVDAEGKELPADKEPLLDSEKKAIRLTFGRHDASRGVVYVRREVEGQDPVVLAVPDPYTPSLSTPPDPHRPPGTPVALSREVRQGYLAFRDRSLPGPGENAAITKVEFVRGGQRYEIRVDEKGQWRMVEPVPDSEVERAVREFLGKVQSEIAAETLLSDQAADEDYAKHNLGDNALIRVAVTVQEKDGPERVFRWYVGDVADPEGPHKEMFHARVLVDSKSADETRANAFLFLIPRSKVRALYAYELRDKTAFARTTGALEALALTWNEIADGKVVKTELQMKFEPDRTGVTRGSWRTASLTVDGKDMTADVGQLAEDRIQILGARLNPLLIERYLVHRATKEDLAKVRLDVSHGERPPALVIEARYGGGAGTRTLLIGERWEPRSDFEAPTPALGAPDTYYHAAAAPWPAVVFEFADWLFGLTPFASPRYGPPNSIFVPVSNWDVKPLVAGWKYFQRTPP